MASALLGVLIIVVLISFIILLFIRFIDETEKTFMDIIDSIVVAVSFVAVFGAIIGGIILTIVKLFT